MDYSTIIRDVEYVQAVKPLAVAENHHDEVYIEVNETDFSRMCFGLHQRLNAPVAALFCVDARQAAGKFILYCLFLSPENKKWFFVRSGIPENSPRFKSIGKEVYSASLFEREMKEMFGIEPEGNPDLRRLHLHDEVWPEGYYPLRKDFQLPAVAQRGRGKYEFTHIEGEGIFEVPVGPVHAGIIGPGHFRFSVAGEPIINLELRLGFTHRGAEKLFEGKSAEAGVEFSEHICGDSAFAYSLAFCSAVEKIYGINVPQQALSARAVFLELERMYGHLTGISGIALDVGFSFPAMFASVIKENILRLNKKLSASRYLKGINLIGGVSRGIDKTGEDLLNASLWLIEDDFSQLQKMLFSSVSFMDRVETTGVLKRKTAEDLGVNGLAGRASGISADLRKIFPAAYSGIEFNAVKQRAGDVLSRLNVRLEEFSESIKIIRQAGRDAAAGQSGLLRQAQPKSGFALGYVESWRGPLLCWIKLDARGLIERCKIVDPSFHNWQALSYAVLGNIIPDFPVCNKSFDLSYPGNDL